MNGNLIQTLRPQRLPSPSVDDQSETMFEVTVVDDNTVAVQIPSTHRTSPRAEEMLEASVGWARQGGYRTILTATTEAVETAHRFLLQHEFVPIAVDALPDGFPRAATHTRCFRRDLAGVVSIRDHDPQWAVRFERERERIVGSLAVPVTIDHTGSTSVPGLAAKPIIDITMTVPDSTDELAYVAALDSVGYALVLREPDWFEHRLFTHDWPRVNLHVFSAGCDEVERMIRFRDHLRAHHPDRELYLRVKRELAAQDWTVVQDYANAKTGVIAEIMNRADKVT
jgi:GrpB-like predicted nucleotidyltransferase (UPF0157 family)